MGLWWDVAWIAFVLMPCVFGLVLIALPLRTYRGLFPVGLAFAVLAVVLTFADFDVWANFARLGATTFLGWWFLGYFETVRVGRPGRLHHPVGRRVLGLARADEGDRRAPPARLQRALVRLPGARASTRPRTSASPTCCSSRSSSAPPTASACASTGRG